MKVVFLTIMDLSARDGSTIAQHYVTKYDEDIQLVAQQKTSRLEGTVTPYPGIIGASKSVDRYGSTEAQEIVTRHGDTNHIEVPHLRRWIDLRDYNHPTLLDKTDTLKVLDDPNNKYVQGAVAAMNRRKDKIIIAALFGNARNVDNTLVALPAGQKVVHGGTNISMAKIRAGIELMNINEADSPEEGGERTFVYTAKQLTILMGDTTLTSSDYNTLEALQNFKVDAFMGMTWKRVEFLPITAGLVRSCGIYGKSYVALGIGQDIVNKISDRADKNHAIQTYTEMSMGAVRVEDAGVVEIQCQE